MSTEPDLSWTSTVKSILSASNGSSTTTTSTCQLAEADLIRLVKLLNKSEAELLTHADDLEAFYSSFLALATHHICTSVSSWKKSTLYDVNQACHIILTYLLNRLQQQNDNCSISKKQLMVLLRSLCKGSSSLPKSDVVTFTALLKSAKMPPGCSIVESAETPEPSASSVQQQKQRVRAENVANVYSQLTSVFDEVHSPMLSPLKSRQRPIPAEILASDDTSATPADDSSQEIIDLFAERNISALQQLNGSDVLLDVCMALTYLKRYKTSHEDSLIGKEFGMPTGMTEALSIRISLQSVMNDISIVWRVFSLPILEPMTRSRLQKIVSITMSCLQASIAATIATSIVSVATGSQLKGSSTSKDDETDGYASIIVQKSLEIFNWVSLAIQKSSKAGGHILQNFQLISAWSLLKGLQCLLHLSPATIFEKVKESSSTKTKQGGDTSTQKQRDSSQPVTSRPASANKLHIAFGPLCIALAAQAVSLMNALLSDLELEGLTALNETDSNITAAELTLFGDFLAIQRVRKLMETINFPNLLMFLVVQLYKKAMSFGKVQAAKVEGLAVEIHSDANSTTSDSNTFYEEDFSSQEESSNEDDDSEPILGHWFEETLSPGECQISTESQAEVSTQIESEGGNNNKGTSGKHGRHNSSSDSVSFLPDKKEPDGYIRLATDILYFIGQYFIRSSNNEVKSCFRATLTDEHMSNLATLIKDLDKELPAVHTGPLFEAFSTAVAHFVHSLIVRETLSDNLQEMLLQHLGINLEVVDGSWPLRMRPRTLAVLAEVLLLRQQKEKDTQVTKRVSEVIIQNIWNQFINSLTNAVVNFDNNLLEFEDVNVEHVQLLVFLFHGLTLMQKKSLWLQLCQCVIKVSEAYSKRPVGMGGVIPLPVTRLLLLIDYLLHYFYDVPTALPDQVQYNLFGVYAGKKKDGADKESILKRYFVCREVEECYTKNAGAKESSGFQNFCEIMMTFLGNNFPKDASMKPRFYNIGPAEYSNQDCPKVDGLACSFLLSNPEQLDYDKFYTAAVTMLAVGSKLDNTGDNLSLLEACSVHYHFVVCWRLLGCLPPSARFLLALEGDNPYCDGLPLLHILRWIPRLAHNTFQTWSKDYLVKQQYTTQNADNLLVNVVRISNNVRYDISFATYFIESEIFHSLTMPSKDDILCSSEMPSLSTIYTLDALVGKIHVHIDDLFKSDANIEERSDTLIYQILMEPLLKLIDYFCVCIKSCLLNQVSDTDDTNQCSVNPIALSAYANVISIGSNRNTKLSPLATTVMTLLPTPVKNILEKWAASSANEFPAVLAWRNAFANDILPVESYLDSIQTGHLSTLSGQHPFLLNASLRHIIQTLVKLTVELANWYPDVVKSEEVVAVLFPLYCYSTTESLIDTINPLMEKFIGPADGDEFTRRTLEYAVDVCHKIIINCSTSDCRLDELVAHECLTYLETHMEKPAGKQAMEKYYAKHEELLNILLLASSSHLSPAYGTKVLKFFNKLMQLADKYPNDKSYEVMCSSLKKLASLEQTKLHDWLSGMIMVPASAAQSEDSKMQENRLLLQSLTSYIVKENSHIGEDVATTILNALIPIGSEILAPTREGIGFPELMTVMAMLAGAGSGSGHAPLFEAATGWLELCKTYLAQKSVIEKIKDNITTGKHQTMLDSACAILSYIKDILTTMKYTCDRQRPSSPIPDAEVQPIDVDSDGIDELAQEDEDSAAEDSDEESLANKLCTYTITQKEFMNQHWYHCHTCKMVDGVGVCTVCAKVCHKDHDLSYAKYGSFFCDCGAKEEDSKCQALTKRTAANVAESHTNQPYANPFPAETSESLSMKRRISSPGSSERQKDSSGWKESGKSHRINETLLRQIEKSKDVLIRCLRESNIADQLIDLLNHLMPSIVENYEELSPLGSMARAQMAMKDLRELPKTIETSDVLMTATLGSQEGAFENVRINYSGDQGQTIRQLITSHVLRRIGMCCLTSPHGKRQHLAVSNEKGKVTMLQLSALLKQAHSSKRKLTLTRLSSAPIPFTVLSIAGSPSNEDFLAVCGLKDCHVLTFTSSGTVADHLVLHPALETGNFIIKAVWLPGSQTELAIVTADFVKIYNLATDAISPQYFFFVPIGKIRDVTFICGEDGRYLLIMNSSGYIYTQIMDDSSSAKHGAFYITNVLDVKHADVKESGGLVAGGGVSIYYSHTLQLIFFSYAQGKTFAAPVTKTVEELPILFPINFKSSNGGKSSGTSQPLVQWTEVHNHPGLICCMTQSSNNPVVMMIKPDVILIQEIKGLPAKSKIQDMVVIRHLGSNSDKRTTLILLCEDGSLRIFMANVDQTNFWMTPTAVPLTTIPMLKTSNKKRRVTQVGRPTGQVTFLVDFFEHCQQSSDIEFGGNDVLQVYNVAQLKHRLNTTGMYVANTKPGGFVIEVNNTSSSTVMVGVRILVGSQSIERAPSFIEIFGRAIPVNLVRHRWYDLPFTREESLTADKKFTVLFGQSRDPNSVTMVDSIKVYTKTKEAFGWPEDSDDSPDSTLPKTPSVNSVPGYVSSETESAIGTSPLPLTPMDKLVTNALEVLDGCFASGADADEKEPLKQTALELSTKLLTLPTPTGVQQQTKSLMASLFSSRSAYHWHKDQAQLQLVAKCLSNFQETRELDGEVFQRLVMIARSIAISRPYNLVQFAERQLNTSSSSLNSTFTGEESRSTVTSSTDQEPEYMKLEPSERQHMIVQLNEAFWFLNASRLDNPLIAPVFVPGLTHTEATVAALIDIMHTFSFGSNDMLMLLCKLYTRLLLSEDQQVSFSCKQALVRVTRPVQHQRRVYISSPPRCSTPGAVPDDSKQGNRSRQSEPPQLHVPSGTERGGSFEVVEPSEQPAAAANNASVAAPHANALEALLAGGANLQALLDIPPDADDETMVQLAIALSLQDQPGGGPGSGNVDAAVLHGLSVQLQEAGHLSDATASGPASDEEVGSTAATEGSTLHTSPADHGESQTGSDSGGSNVDSVSVSGRSSATGDVSVETVMTGTHASLNIDGKTQGSLMTPEYEGLDQSEMDLDMSQRLHALRIRILDRLISYLPELRNINGMRAIPFLQLILALTYELNSDENKDRPTLDTLLTALIAELHIDRRDVVGLLKRTDTREIQLLILRLLSVLMSRTKMSTGKTSSEISSFVSQTVGYHLVGSGMLEFCLHVLQTLLDVCKTSAGHDADVGTAPGQLLKPRLLGTPPDMSPFFLRQYIKGHASDVFADYPQLLMEIVLRLPYQLKKIAEANPNMQPVVFDNTWYKVLAEYMMTLGTSSFVKKQVRKLLLYVCGSKEKYRLLRDMHFLEKHMTSVKTVCEQRGLDVLKQDITYISLTYDMLISVIEHLKACLEIATTRTINWQKFCQKDEGILPFLVLASVSLDDGVAPLLLQLLQCVLCGSKSSDQQSAGKSAAAAVASPAKGQKTETKKEEKSEETKQDSEDVNRHDEALCVALVQQVCKTVSRDLLVRFIVCFLLESNQTSVRWQAHALVLHIYRSSPINQREALLDLMWNVWPDLPTYGCKAAQFVDLLGYFTIKTPQASDKKMKVYVEKALALMRVENKILANHPNGSIYNILQGLVDFDGYYLERDPCLVCNNPEVPFANIKLSSIKVDSKFTTSTQIVKLAGSHTISKFILKITDLKRTKMVQTLIVYYNNRQVQAVVELKNKPGLWHKAKKVVLSSGQTEVKVEFPLPIVACNLMIEYASFYDNHSTSAETLQCPRCSASVAATPGVCGNCGENVFQCHKCRAINYDEKDPFLCNACGYCKYAKFDFAMTAKPCCAVDPIENEEDRKKAVTTINSLLERADHQYKQLQLYKTSLDGLLVKISDHTTMDSKADEATPAPTSGASATAAAGAGGMAINKTIQQLAQKYCNDCRSAFDDLSKVIQKVMASRKELVDYDRQQQDIAHAASIPTSTISTPVVSPRSTELFSMARDQQLYPTKPREKRSHCYGCASATVEHCITLLRAMATNPTLKNFLCGQGVIRELVDYNLRRGAPSLRTEVRHLLCLMSSNNSVATDELNEILSKNITMAMDSHLSNPDFAAAVRHEMCLLGTLLQLEDFFWEQRVRCVMKLFMASMRIDSPPVQDCVSLPCLRILQHIIKPPSPTSKKHKDKPLETLCTVQPLSDLRVDIRAWLAGDPSASFQAWRQSMPSKPAVVESQNKKKKDEKVREKDVERRVVRVRYLMEKYAAKWKSKVTQAGCRTVPLKLMDKSWLRKAMFSTSSAAMRQTECNIVEAMCIVQSRKQDLLDMLSGCLDEIGTSGESAAEFLTLYKKLIAPGHWKYYLALKGILGKIASLITKEIEELSKLEETSLSSDLSQGYALKALTDLLATFLEVDQIKHHYKSRLVGSVLNGYLSLRKLVIQRTKLIDDTQDKLLELLEEMTTGNESETKEFMAVCVETVNKYPLNDFISPVFIFERLCSIIFPEANDAGEFFMSLEKEPQQEDFLQGRMLGNPYSSNEPGLGPLMRDVKNKICQDCELVALLDDDTGMELLVCNKIISLDLAVKDVHRHIWLPEHSEGEPMRIVYRMRGLLGDATEDMVNSLETGKDLDVDCEEVYKMANVMSYCSGLKVMLHRLSSIRNLVTGKQLMCVLLKLFGYCLKVKINRKELIKVEMNTITIMLGALNLALLAEQESGTSTKGQTLTEQILQIMETILLDASSQPLEMYKAFSKLCGDKDQLMVLLDRINSPFVRANVNVLQALMRLIPFLAFGDQEKMQALVNHFRPYLDFNRYDFDHTQDEQVHLDCFCVIAQGIEKNANGKKLKDLISEHSIVKDALHYVQMHAPTTHMFQQNIENDSWKEMISKPSLPYVLRMLSGLCGGHETIQMQIGNEIIPILHNLEQVSSDEHVGSLAENLLEALKENPQVAKMIEDVRQQTKTEKKRMAMAMREKQLDQLGMKTNEKGQVTVKGTALRHMEDLKDETGLTCCICREGYRYQPLKVLGIYTFTKRVNLDDGESKSRKAHGYSTVSHFNIVHVDCHLAAVRHARAREEWDSAALQNGNTKCNGLLPLWGPEVLESAYASCLAKHNGYLQECTGVRDATYSFTMHDLKHLLLKFAFEKSFSEDSGGGGRESNMQLIPHIMHMALYVINTTRSAQREEKNLANFLKLPVEKWVESCYEVEGPLYWMVMAVHIYDQNIWKRERLTFLKRLIVLAHARNVAPAGGTSISDKTVKEYSVYKPYLMFFGLVDALPNSFYRKCSIGNEGNWPSALAEYIRQNDQALLENAKKVLTTFEEELLPCESLVEFCDVAGLLEDIPQPDSFIQEVLMALP